MGPVLALCRTLRVPTRGPIPSKFHSRICEEGWSWACFCLQKNILLSCADAQDDWFITGSTVDSQ